MLYDRGMKRTQLQLDEYTWEILRERAFQEKRSVSDVVREMLKLHIHKGRGKPLGISSFSFIGAGVSHGERSGRIARKHDEELGEAFGPKKKV